MLASLVLLALPINNPFPVTLALSVAAIVAFGVELMIARQKVHPRKWLYILLSGYVAFWAVLALWSAYYTLFGPSAAEPRFRIAGQLFRSTYYDLYSVVWIANVALFFLILLLVFVTWLLLVRQQRNAHVAA